MKNKKMSANVCHRKKISDLKWKAGLAQKKIVSISNGFVLSVELIISFDGHLQKKQQTIIFSQQVLYKVTKKLMLH